MNFSLIEKLAVVKSLDDLILANEEIADEEIDYLEKVMKELDFRSDFVDEARKMRTANCIEILNRMEHSKKTQFSEMLHNMALADGFADEYEINLIISLYEQLGLNRNGEIEVMDFPNLNYLLFDAAKQYVYPTGFSGERTLEDKSSTIKIEVEINQNDLFNLTIFQESKIPKLWGLDIVFPTRSMRFSTRNQESTELKSSDNNQTLWIFHRGPEIESVKFSDESRGLYSEYFN